MNFVTAMPRFAASAAMIALVPPEVLIFRSPFQEGKIIFTVRSPTATVG